MWLARSLLARALGEVFANELHATHAVTKRRRNGESAGPCGKSGQISQAHRRFWHCIYHFAKHRRLGNLPCLCHLVMGVTVLQKSTVADRFLLRSDADRRSGGAVRARPKRRQVNVTFRRSARLCRSGKRWPDNHSPGARGGGDDFDRVRSARTSRTTFEIRFVMTVNCSIRSEISAPCLRNNSASAAVSAAIPFATCTISSPAF